jgi:ribosomal subunit interface protein
MDILVQAKNMKATKALRAFIENQTGKLRKLGMPISRVRVFLENIARKDSDPQRASVQMEVTIPGKGKVTVKNKAHDLYLAITETVSSLTRHVRKEKEKRVDIARRKQRHAKHQS